MGKRETSIPKAPLARILVNKGAQRVSAKGIDTFSDMIEEVADNIAKRALELSKHSGRKTILDEDIKLAAKTIYE